MKTVTVKTQTCNISVELTNATGNNTRYLLMVGNSKVYTHDDLTVDNTDFCWLINYVNDKFDYNLNASVVLNNIISLYMEAESKVDNTYDVLRSLESMDIVPTFDVKPASADYVPGATKVPYTNSSIPEGFDAEANELNFDNTISLLVDIKPQVKSIIIDSLYSVADRVFNLGGRLCKAPHVPNSDDLYDEAYYGKFEVGYRFCNWDGTPSLWNE